MEIATGHVTATCKSQHRRQESLAFLKQVTGAQQPEGQLHLVKDNYAVHKTPRSEHGWSKTQVSGALYFHLNSWLNLMEVWFGIIEHQALHPADVASVAEFNKRIRPFVTGWNDRCLPFVWTKASTEILKIAKRLTTPRTDH